jgi:hypothetical protein
MAELGEGLSGYLDVQDATLRAPRLEAVSNIGIANTAPQHAFSVGSNLYVDTESSNVLTVDGNVVCEGVKVGLIEIIPSYDLAAVSNVGNVTQSTIQFSNATTGFVTTANIEVGTANLFVDTVSGRVGIGKTDPGATLEVVGDVEISGHTVLGTATYRKKIRWNRNELAYVYLGNIQTNNTTGIRLDVSLNAANSGYEMYQFQITLNGNDNDHAGGNLVYSAQGGDTGNTLKQVDIGYVYVGSGGSYEYQLWLKDPTTDTTGAMDAYLNCQGYYNFDTGVSDVAQGGAAPTNFNLGTPSVVVDKFGNVGIGTNEPDTQLEIKNGASGTLIGLGEHHLKLSTSNALAYSTDDVGPGIVFTQRYSNASGVDRPTGAIYGVKTTGNGSNGGGLTFAYQNSSQELTRSITMNHEGNVGIGTTDPGNPLVIYGPDQVNTFSAQCVISSNSTTGVINSGGTLLFQGHDGVNGRGWATVSGLKENGTSGNYASYLRFDTRSSGASVLTERMRITSNGNVGIGTDNPYSYQLVAPGRVCLGQLGLAHRNGSSTSLKQVSHSNGSDRVFQFKLNSTSSWTPGFFKMKVAVVNNNGSSGFAWDWEAGFKVIDNNNSMDMMTTMSGADPGSSWFSRAWDGSTRVLTLTAKDASRTYIVAEATVVFYGGIQDD